MNFQMFLNPLPFLKIHKTRHALQKKITFFNTRGLTGSALYKKSNNSLNSGSGVYIRKKHHGDMTWENVRLTGPSGVQFTEAD